MAKEIKITVKDTDIKKMISSIMDHPQSELIAANIVENLENTEEGFKNVYHAFLGIQSELSDFNLQIGSMVPVKVSDNWDLSKYYWDEEKMKDAQLILNDSIECQVAEYTVKLVKIYENK